MTELAGFNRAVVGKRTDWTDELFSLRINGANLDFKAGQFTKLALPGKMVKRSVVLTLW